jgi:hypothetical protein
MRSTAQPFQLRAFAEQFVANVSIILQFVKLVLGVRRLFGLVQKLQCVFDVLIESNKTLGLV